MLLSVRLDSQAACLWHLWLLERLAGLPDVNVVIEPGFEKRRPPFVERLLYLETLREQQPRPGAASPIPDGSLDRYEPNNTAEPDLILDLCGEFPSNSSRVWRLSFDGAPGEVALLSAILLGRSPVAEIREGDRIIAAGRLGTESNGMLLATFEDALARTITLIAGAFSGASPRLPEGDQPTIELQTQVSSLDLGGVVVKTLSNRVLRRLYRVFYQTPHWRVGWRKLDGPDLFNLRRHPDTGWHDLPDDNMRFYADPFPIAYRGDVTLFVEEYPHSTGKGIISAVRFGPDGPLGRPEPVLELPYHLSYPFVFEQDGAIWMVPESCASGTIDLFRATRFPGGWVKEATLVDGVTASDATLCEAGGRWWLFATVKDGGSYSDALHLWSAPDFRGPWTPHAHNPVLIDIASARPAGRIVQRDGALFRPVQDCRLGYGAALGLARIHQLDDRGFAQHVETILTAGSRWAGRCLHTVNRAGPFEFIDGSGSARRPLLARWKAA